MQTQHAKSTHEDIMQRQRFNQNGFVAISGFISPDEVMEVKDNIARYIRDVIPVVPGGEAFYEIKGQPETLKQIQRMQNYDKWFSDLFNSDRVVGLAERLLNGPVLGKNLQWFNKPPGNSTPTPAHQDGYYFMIEPSEAVTMWLALDMVDEENGCVRYVQGSHTRGMRSHGKTGVLGFSQGIVDYSEDDRAREVAVPATPGDLVAHHSLTIHRADSNRSSRTRKALGFIYYSSLAIEKEEAHARYQAEVRQEWAKGNRL